LEDAHIEQDVIDEAIRKAVFTSRVVPLFCGSALKNKGIQPLLDGVLKYLPSPERIFAIGKNAVTGAVEKREPTDKGKLCALAFKVVNDKDKGLVTFFRVYQGIIKNRMKIKNANLNESERISGLFRVRADETQILPEIGVGDIGAIIGCKNIRSGDTIIEELDNDRIILDGVKMPPPVFFCSIEAENSRDQTQLESILFNLTREDPSLNVKTDQETGQLLVSGQGELHLEILRDRIELEYNLKADLGPMRVAYRESVGTTQEFELTLDKTVGGSSMFAQLKFRIESTLEDFDMTEIQKAKFEGSDETIFETT
jgi:elongation factor G